MGGCPVPIPIQVIGIIVSALIWYAYIYYIPSICWVYVSICRLSIRKSFKIALLSLTLNLKTNRVQFLWFYFSTMVHLVDYLKQQLSLYYIENRINLFVRIKCLKTQLISRNYQNLHNCTDTNCLIIYSFGEKFLNLI